MYSDYTVKLVASLITLSALLLLTGNCSAKNSLSFTREMIVDDQSEDVVRPNAMARSEDGGLIVAGYTSSVSGAAVIKTDADGKFLWRYTTRSRAQYYEAVGMPDGTTYACGTATGALAASGMLTHLDANGHALGDWRFAPLNASEHVMAYVDDCTRWGDGLALIGHVELPPATEGRPRRMAYWLMALDAAGRLKWEKIIPSSLDLLRDIRPLVVEADGSLVFSGARIYMGTELFRIAPTGEILDQSKIAGATFGLLQSVAAGGTLKLYGYDLQTRETMLLSLNDRLQEVHRQIDNRHDFGAHSDFRLPDETLLLFGSNIHKMGARFTPGVMHLTPTLEQTGSLDLASEPDEDVGYVRAATPTRRRGEFAAARTVVRNGPSGKSVQLLVLDFIQVD
jgi:hypothetical protein